MADSPSGASMLQYGQPPFFECSSKGDRRFSAFSAQIRARGNLSIETLYQAAKRFPDGSTGLSWRAAKGKAAINMDEVRALYGLLWDEYIAENPHLAEPLLAASGLSDVFGQDGHACQATELWRIRTQLLDAGREAPPPRILQDAEITYAGIGSRETPQYVLALMTAVAKLAAQWGWTLRSGGADGADSAFEVGCDAAKGKKQIFLPWDGFNDRRGMIQLPPLAAEIAARYHPAWPHLKQGPRKLHTRNVGQVLGRDLQSPANVVVCWTKDGALAGGTAQALRISEGYGVPTVNLGHPDAVLSLAGIVRQVRLAAGCLPFDPRLTPAIPQLEKHFPDQATVAGILDRATEIICGQGEVNLRQAVIEAAREEKLMAELVAAEKSHVGYSL